MKKYLIILSSILIITSCDVEEGPFITDYNSYINPDKKVLIEDFTGHLCPNCPNAARELDAIHDIYGDQIIGMAVHVSTTFARPYSSNQAPNFQYDFRTDWGNGLDDFYGISAVGLPRGMVNRIGYPDNHKLGAGEWAAAVLEELTKDTTFTIDISSDESSISIISEVQKNINAEYNLAVCLTESNIINWQQDGGNSISDYEHNHVLRTALIDQALSNSTNYVAGQEIENTINYDLATLKQSNIDYSNNSVGGNGAAGGWDANNMSVVAYIYNTITKEIVQVEEAHLNN